ncbi:MAG: FAD binding domain-containing protein [Ginsengibacter sp.]
MIEFILNNKEIITEQPPGYLLLDFVRYQKHLSGTKIGCREGDCGACTVLVGDLMDGKLVYRSMTSCLLPLGNVHHKHIVTIEGTNLEKLNAVQQAMSDEGATQCGFCTPGFVVSLTGFCLQQDKHSYDDAIASINGNICRCTGYKSIERAASSIASLMQTKEEYKDAIDFVTENEILPIYFKTIKKRLLSLKNKSNGILQQSDGKFLGGGTDLYVQQAENMVHADIKFLYDASALKGIEKKNNKCIIGGAATVTDILESAIFRDHFPKISTFLKLVSSTPIRNMATIAGNFVNASPIGDFTIFFLALNAQIKLREGSHSRLIPLQKFYKGYKELDKSPGEMIESIEFDLPGKNSFFNFEKVSKRTHLDIASVNTAVYLEVENEKIVNAFLSAGGVGPVPMVLKNSSVYLKNKEISTELIDDMVEIMKEEISPISDARGTKEYKILLLTQLVKAHFITLFPTLRLDDSMIL